MKPIISFLLPSHSKNPVGGFKVVYEYANRFASDGFRVNIVYPSTVSFKEEKFIKKIKSILRFYYFKINANYTPYNWFDLDKKIYTYWVRSLNQKNIPNSDVIIATSAETAKSLHEYTFSGKKIYFIQGYETWFNGEDDFLKTLDLPLSKIVISPHLLKVVESRKQTAELLLNGFDFNYFKKEIKIEIRDKYNVAMLYHMSEAKGSSDGLKALQIVKDKFPLLKASLFGYPKKPNNLPSWVTYYQAPSKELHNEIYNKAAIFLGTSYSEGWGLTIGEAMICGCAVACTDIDGYRIMAQNEQTALLSDAGDFQAMAGNIIKLIEDDELRFKISVNGNSNIQMYKWDKSYDDFKKII